MKLKKSEDLQNQIYRIMDRLTQLGDIVEKLAPEVQSESSLQRAIAMGDLIDLGIDIDQEREAMKKEFMGEEVKRDAGPPAPPKPPVEPDVEYIKEGQFIRKENPWEKYPVGTKVRLHTLLNHVSTIFEWGQGCQFGKFRIVNSLCWFPEESIVEVVPAQTYAQGWLDGRTDLIRNIRSVEKFLGWLDVCQGRILEDYQIEEYRIKRLLEEYVENSSCQDEDESV